MKFIINIVSIVTAVLVFSSCSKQATDPLMDARPEVPVNFTNAIANRPDPTVTCSLKDSIITIKLEIPAQSGRTIAQISRIATSTSYSKIQGTSGLFVSTPITVNATSYTYTTTLKAYFAFNGGSATANSELANRFYFLVMLDNGAELITTPVRILILS